MVDLNKVMTFTEAAEKWGLAGGNTLRQAVSRGKFKPYEVKKSGTVWLTTYEAMNRVFGEPVSALLRISQTQIIGYLQKKQTSQLAALNQEIEKALENAQKVAITETLASKEFVLYIFSTYPEYQNWLALISRGQLSAN